MISVIMPSYLGVYPNCATNREDKFRRAIDSFLSQTFSDRELIIVSDGCFLTNQIHFEEYRDKASIRIINKEFDGNYNGKNRQMGVDAARGEIITYLDTDDFYSPDHLQSINRQVQNYDFVYFDDFVLMGWDDKQQAILKRRESELQHKKVGTTFIAHRKVFRSGYKPTWEGVYGYGEDWDFIKRTMKHLDPNRVAKIHDCGYINCHVPYLNIDN